jgi:hypothetical protein
MKLRRAKEVMHMGACAISLRIGPRNSGCGMHFSFSTLHNS